MSRIGDYHIEKNKLDLEELISVFAHMQKVDLKERLFVGRGLVSLYV